MCIRDRYIIWFLGAFFHPEAQNSVALLPFSLVYFVTNIIITSTTFFNATSRYTGNVKTIMVANKFCTCIKSHRNVQNLCRRTGGSEKVTNKGGKVAIEKSITCNTVLIQSLRVNFLRYRTRSLLL